MGTAQGTGLPIAALLMPILALIVVAAVDSVEPDDGPFYRVFVMVCGIGAIGPMAIVVLLGIISTSIPVESGTLLPEALISASLTILLILGVVLQETYRGIDDPQRKWYGVGLIVVFLMYVGFYIYL